jgi:hypothetical protein
MEQHAIPQQISSYQFRLVGDMTLKQFFQLAGGCLVALLFYASALPPIIKWPMIIFFGLLGVALAFLPFEERPLEKWIIAFFRSIYTPTIFAWVKSPTPERFFQDEELPQQPTPQQPAGYVQPIGTGTLFGKLEQAESSFLNSISQLFSLPSSAKIETAPGVTPPKGPMNVPFNSPTQIVTGGYKPKVLVEEKNIPVVLGPVVAQTTAVAPSVQYQSNFGAHPAQFSMQASPPTPPTQPNTLVGQIFDNQGKILSGVILEIRDSAGRPVRALRSNMLGHFMVVTPLSNGRYEIITEKDGFIFDPVTFDAMGNLIPPILIRAKSADKIMMVEEVTQPQLSQ